MAAPLLKLGTRGSRLALIQAGLVRDALAAAVPALAAPDAIEIVAIRTTGDAIQDRPLSEAGGKGLFVKEIEEALLARRIDAAVHSMKDLPTELPKGLTLAAIPQRAEPYDAIVGGRRQHQGSRFFKSLRTLPPMTLSIFVSSMPRSRRAWVI